MGYTTYIPATDSNRSSAVEACKAKIINELDKRDNAPDTSINGYNRPVEVNSTTATFVPQGSWLENGLLGLAGAPTQNDQYRCDAPFKGPF